MQDFEEKYQLLVAGWDSFHQSYDQWRKTEGGCDRAEVVSDLGRFSLQFSDIASKVRDLPRATSLRPMGELFVEAARLEEQALKSCGIAGAPSMTEPFKVWTASAARPTSYAAR